MIELSSIEFDCRVVTPMFLGGAEPNEKPEIRAQSIKGLLRWHWRALQDPTWPIEKLKEVEGKLFGIAADKAGESIKSPVSILVTKQPEVSHFNIKDVEGKKLQGPQNLEGNRGYLLYFTHAGITNDKAYWDTNTTFSVRFTASPDYVEDLKTYADLFNFMSVFGGLGSRNSRVMGGFVIGEVSKNTCGWDEAKLDWVVEDFAKEMIPRPEQPAPVSYESHRMSSIVEFDTSETKLNKALDVVGYILKQVRKQNKEVRDQGLFGLPVKVTKNYVGTKQRVNRQASPLRIRMYKDGDVYIAVIQLHWLIDFSIEEYRNVFNSLVRTVKATLERDDDESDIILYNRAL